MQTNQSGHDEQKEGRKGGQDKRKPTTEEGRGKNQYWKLVRFSSKRVAL